MSVQRSDEVQAARARREMHRVFHQAGIATVASPHFVQVPAVLVAELTGALPAEGGHKRSDRRLARLNQLLQTIGTFHAQL